MVKLIICPASISDSSGNYCAKESMSGVRAAIGITASRAIVFAFGKGG
jgi:hypothetical protein